MKAIQIPKNSNPFIVVINNKAYSYAAGEAVEVPDEVAEAIEDAIALEPKPYPVGYSKIATLTVKAGADGTLPRLATINVDEYGKHFRVRDFFFEKPRL